MPKMYQDKAEVQAEERILDVLLPPARPAESKVGFGNEPVDEHAKKIKITQLVKYLERKSVMVNLMIKKLRLKFQLLLNKLV